MSANAQLFEFPASSAGQSFVRRMRGPSRSACIETAGWRYVVKPPRQGMLPLINEWLGSHLLRMAGVMTADVLAMRIQPEAAEAAWPQERFSHPLWCAAVAYPVPPSQPVYDFFPEVLADRIANLDHILGALAVDVWAGQTKSRQVVVYRQGPWWICAIDHSGLFGGQRWDCQPHGSLFNPAMMWAYRRLNFREEMESWVEKIERIPAASIIALFERVPECFRTPGLDAEIRRLAELLLRRRCKLRTELAQLGAMLL